MKKVLRRRPSAAMVIAVLALIAALAGTAIAGGGFVPKPKFKKFKQSTNTQLSQTLKGPVTFVNQTQTVDAPFAGAGVNVTATCPSGDIPISGGAKTNTNSATSNFFILNTYPSATGWTALVYSGPSPESVTVTAVCAKATTSGAPPAISP